MRSGLAYQPDALGYGIESMPRICLIPNVSGTGGMVSFRYKLTAGLEARGIQVTNDLADTPYQAVLIIGGTRQLAALWRVHRKGIRLVQRLDGINWIQRKRPTGVRHFIRAELGNLLQSSIRKKLADRIVYQSIFSKNWWENWYGKVSASDTIIYNGVDLKIYTPANIQELSPQLFRLLVVEGSLGGGYDTGLENALSLAKALAFSYQLPIELMVVGQVKPSLQSYWDNKSHIPIRWEGTVKRESIPEIDRSAHLLFAADLHPACPNSVIEALACGLPVAAFDTGALTELVPINAGCIAPYGSDPWRVEKPDIPGLAAMAAETLINLPSYQKAARAWAELSFDLDVMVGKYLDVLLEAI